MNQIDFDRGSVHANIMQAALPMLAAQILSLLYSIVDRMYIGRIPGTGTLALGGVGLCFPVVMLMTAFANLYGFGGAPLCAMERGRGNKEAAGKVMNTAYFMLLFCGILLTAAAYILAVPMLRLFGASDETLPYAYSYLQIYAAGTVPYMLATGLNPYINAQGFARKGMQTVFIGAVSNIILDPVMIFGLGLGIRGAAIATVLSQILSMVCALRFLYSGQAELRLSLLKPRDLDLHLVSNITGLGFSNFVMQFTNSLVAVVCNHVLSGYGGDIAVSVYTIVSSVRQIMDVPLLAVSNGSGPVLSYNYGARRPERLKEAIRIICRLGVAYTVLSWLLILTFPEFFIRIFSSDPELISHAVPALHIYFFAFIFQVFQYCAQSVFKSLNMKYRAIFFSLFRKVVLVVPLTLILPRIGGLGAKGVYMAEPISNALGGMASFTTMMLTVYLRLGKEEV